MFVSFIVKDDEYKLRLTTKSLVDLEARLGYNPIQLFMNMRMDKIPLLKDLLIILHEMLKPLQHNIKMEDVYDIFDKYTEDGKTQFDLIPIFLDVFTQCGFISDEGEEEPKN